MCTHVLLLALGSHGAHRVQSRLCKPERQKTGPGTKVGKQRQLANKFPVNDIENTKACKRLGSCFEVRLRAIPLVLFSVLNPLCFSPSKTVKTQRAHLGIFLG
eukprot:439494-Amphidinium_carterae.1